MNTKRKITNVVGILMVLAILLASSVINVSASPPSNDNFADATTIIDFPFSESSDTTEATIEPGDPMPWCVSQQYNSIWYAYTPANDTSLIISANTDYMYYITVAIYQDDGGLTQISCQSVQWQLSPQMYYLSAGVTYYFEVMARYAFDIYPPPEPTPPTDGGPVTINFSIITPPSNDNWVDATVIQQAPFSDTVDTTYATTEPGEPAPNCYWNFQRTIWYAFTPATDGIFTIDSSGGYYTVLAVYTGSELNNMQSVACASGWGGTQIVLQGEAGITYYLQTHFSDWGEIISININQVYPPANDDFANAKAITAAPFTESVDAIYATTEPNEPTCGWNFHKTLWYAFTPATTGSYTAEASGGGQASLAVYQGTGFENFIQLACATDYTARVTLVLEAGKTYYVQTHINDEWWSNWVNINLYPTPPPQASFYYSPPDPNKFETIQFYDNSYDPVYAGFQAYDWNFGDGSTASGCCPTHHFSADGDYSVQLTVTTNDGRTASTTQTVVVRTHDVGVTRFVVPTSARVGQTRQVNVYVKNLYYPETVRVELYKSTINGYELVGSLTQTMPVRPANRAQIFSFNYTFSSADADIGKVTFRVVATVIDARDAYPADNEAISFATKVTR